MGKSPRVSVRGFEQSLTILPPRQLGCLPDFTVKGQWFHVAYLGSDISPGTPPCSWNCWRCQSSRRRRTACTADSCCQRSSVWRAPDRDQEPLANGTGSCRLGKEGGKKKDVKEPRNDFIATLQLWVCCWVFLLRAGHAAVFYLHITFWSIIFQIFTASRWVCCQTYFYSPHYIVSPSCCLHWSALLSSFF